MKFIEALNIKDKLPYDEWAEAEYCLPIGNRYQGSYIIDRSPQTREILKALTPGNGIEKVVVKKPTQAGITLCLNIFIAGTIDQDPGHILMILPTETLAKSHSLKKQIPEFSCVKALDGKFPKRKSREAGNTVLLKMFPGGSLELGGANQTGLIRSQTARYLLMSDVDGYELDSGEGHVISVFERRTDQWTGNRKIVIESTPCWAGTSMIDVEYEASSQGKYITPCNNCGKFMLWDMHEKEEFGFKYIEKNGIITDSFMVCKHCGNKIKENDKYELIRKSVYNHKYQERKRISCGFFFTSWTVPGLSWNDIALDHFRAKDDVLKQQVFYNTRRGKSYDMPGSKEYRWEKVKKYALDYLKFTVPDFFKPGAFVLGCGVDTQDDKLVVVVRAYTRTKSCLVWNGQLHGDPAYNEVWGQLESILFADFRCEAGTTQRIISCGIDTGGHRYVYVKNFCKKYYPNVIPIRGARISNAPLLTQPRQLEVNEKGKSIPSKKGSGLYLVGTFQAKIHFLSSLETADKPIEERKNFYYLADDQYFREITAVKLTNKMKNGSLVPSFIASGRDDYLSAEAYAFASVSRYLNNSNIAE